MQLWLVITICSSLYAAAGIISAALLTIVAEFTAHLQDRRFIGIKPLSFLFFILFWPFISTLFIIDNLRVARK